MVVHPEKIAFVALSNDLIDYFIVCFEQIYRHISIHGMCMQF